MTKVSIDSPDSQTPTMRNRNPVKKHKRSKAQIHKTSSSLHPPLDLHNEIAEKLSSTDKKIREKSLRVLYKFLQLKGNFSEQEFSKLWSAILTAVQICDNILIEKDLLQKIASLIHAFSSQWSLWVKSFFKTTHQALHTTNPKFQSKVLKLWRLVLRETFILLQNKAWSNESLVYFREILPSTVFQLETIGDFSFSHYFIEIFIEEFLVVSKIRVSGDTLMTLLSGFVIYICDEGSELQIVDKIVSNIFEELLKLVLNEDFHNNQDNGLLQALSIVLSISETFQDLSLHHISPSDLAKRHAYFITSFCNSVHSELELIYQQSLNEQEEPSSNDVAQNIPSNNQFNEVDDLNEDIYEEIEGDSFDEDFEGVPLEDSELEYYGEPEIQKPLSTGPRKRVRFDLSCNTYQDFAVHQKNLLMPICLTPSKTPIKSLLKSPLPFKENLENFNNSIFTPMKSSRHDKIANRQQTPKKPSQPCLEAALYL